MPNTEVATGEDPAWLGQKPKPDRRIARIWGQRFTNRSG